MPRLFLGRGRGYNSKTGFRNPTNPRSFNRDFIRPPFTVAVSHFIRKTAATHFTPMAVGSEGGAVAYTLSIGSGSIGLSGTAINLKYNKVVSISSGALSLVGTGINLKYGRAVQIGSGSLSLAGTGITVKADRIVSIGSGALVLAGTNIGANYNKKISIGQGDLSLLGTEIVLKADRKLSLDNGEIVISGVDLNLKKGFTLSISSGAITLNGTDITLTQSVQFLSDALKLYNGFKLGYHLIPQDEDLHIMADGEVIGILVVAASDDQAGAIRIKVNNVVKALKLVA